jgi:dihydropyrimidinase
MRTVIRNGTVVSAADTYRADVLVDGERVTAIGTFPADIDADASIDAAGRLVLPGAIDVHTHLDMPFGGTMAADDFESGTVAAAHGGTTTVVDFAMQSKGQRLHDAWVAWARKAEGKAVIDYGFHMIVTDLNDQVEREMDDLVREGITSFKVFMAYKGALMLDDAGIFRLLLRSRENGALVSVHAENGDVIDVLVRRALAAGQTSPRYHALTRPAGAEAEATRRAIALAEMAGARIYIVHLSAAEALEAVSRARRRGARVLAETCPQYLFLSSDNYDEPGFDGAKYVMSPPLRAKETQGHLWRGLAAGDLQTVATDHCPFRMSDQKILGRDDFSKIPNGAPGIETRLSLLYDGGVRTGRISLNRFVDVTSTSPAKIFGLYPRKGTIAPGSDADLVVFDPEKRAVISAKTHHMKVDYNPYEGREVVGVAQTVLSRGRTIVEDGRFVGGKGCGLFLKRAAG